MVLTAIPLSGVYFGQKDPVVRLKLIHLSGKDINKKVQTPKYIKAGFYIAEQTVYKFSSYCMGLREPANGGSDGFAVVGYLLWQEGFFQVTVLYLFEKIGVLF